MYRITSTPSLSSFAPTRLVLLSNSCVRAISVIGNWETFQVLGWTHTHTHNTHLHVYAYRVYTPFTASLFIFIHCRVLSESAMVAGFASIQHCTVHYSAVVCRNTGEESDSSWTRPDGDIFGLAQRFGDYPILRVLGITMVHTQQFHLEYYHRIFNHISTFVFARITGESCWMHCTTQQLKGLL